MAKSPVTLISQKPKRPRVGSAATAIAVPPEAITSSTVSVPNTPSATATYVTLAIASARYIARGSCFFGSGRSFAVKVITPKPRNAKNVSATLETMSRTGGYVDGSSSDGSMFTIVTTANVSRIPTTIHTITVCTFATAWEPTTFSHSITRRTTAAKTLTHTAPASSPRSSDAA